MGQRKKRPSGKPRTSDGKLRGGGKPFKWDWPALKVEFFASNAGSDLFRKAKGIPERTWRGNAADWHDLRREYKRKVAEKAIARGAENQTRRFERVLGIISKLQRKIEELIRFSDENKAPLPGKDISGLSSALKNLIESDFLLRGEPTSRVGIVFEGGLFAKAVEVLASIVRRRVPDRCPECKANLGIRPTIARDLVEAKLGFDDKGAGVESGDENANA